MFGASPYLQDSFGLSKSEAKKVLIKWMKSFDESVNEAAFPEWEVTFKKMNLSGVKLDPKNVYKVKASGTAMAIKKAAKAAGVSDSDWIATETDSIKKL